MKSLDRRKFLVHGLGVGASFGVIRPTWPRLGRRSVHGAGPSEDRVLVVVQLSGGNDGLNTVVPHRQDGYFRARPTLALSRPKLHPLDGDHGLHPSLAGLGERFAEGGMTVIHGVGYPRPNRSHFRSMEIWHTAETEGLPTGPGWLGRMADQLVSRAPGTMPALHVGDESRQLVLRGREFFAPTVRDATSLALRELDGLAPGRQALSAEEGGHDDLAFLREAARGAYRAAERMERAAARSSAVDYPDLGLARKLRLIARLVTGGFDTRLFLVILDGFDTHARQAALHAARLDELSRSLCAFRDDLSREGAAARVATLVFSEFGRRVEENGSRGTDHGAAAPVLLLGGPGPGGVLGSAPDLEHLVEGDVPHTTDFRALYTALECDWMGLLPSTRVPALQLGG